jgi:hypothetical protein
MHRGNIACTHTKTCTVSLYENAPSQQHVPIHTAVPILWKKKGISCRLHAHMPRHENMSTQLLTSRAEANAHTYVVVCLKVYVQSTGAVPLPTRFILNGTEFSAINQPSLTKMPRNTHIHARTHTHTHTLSLCLSLSLSHTHTQDIKYTRTRRLTSHAQERSSTQTHTHTHADRHANSRAGAHAGKRVVLHRRDA